MASNVSEECKNAAMLQEKEEGEISLEDVSSSEEGHANNYQYSIRSSQCASCMSFQHCGMWCTTSSRMCHRRSQNRREIHLISQDAVQGKENWHHIKDSTCSEIKHTSSTLQEKNDDLVPISSDSDMEIIGLVDNSKHMILHSVSKPRSKVKRKRKRAHTSMLQLEDLVSPSSIDPNIIQCTARMPHNTLISKESHLPRSHHRDMSPIHRSKSRVLPRSPPRRHRSPTRGRSSFKRSRTPINDTRSPAMRRSPRRVRSPRRSPYRSPVRPIPRKVVETDPSPPRTYVDKYGNVTKLLKRVKQLDSIGVHSLQTTISKNKEHASSLKEKLFNMMKELSDTNGNVTSYSKGKSNTQMKRTNEVDDDEDLALLRQQALETKQKKSPKHSESSKNDNESNLTANDDDQDDEEMMKLRIIALRSAVLKKHQNRVRKGMKAGKNKKPSTSRSESPFSQSFLDSIPLHNEERDSLSTPPHSPPLNEKGCLEDMETVPYSPTDKITSSVPMDTEMLGIQSSDVSFISFADINTSPAFAHTHFTEKQDSPPPNTPRIQGSTAETPLASIPYSPSDPIDTPTYTELKKVHTPIPTPSVPNTLPAKSLDTEDCNNICKGSDVTTIADVPYSPTDTPLYDPDLSQSVSKIKNTPTSVDTNHSQELFGTSYGSSSHNTVQENPTFVHLKPVLPKDGDNIQEACSSNETDSVSLRPRVGSATPSLDGSTSPNSSMITIDDLPETDADISPRVPNASNPPNIPSIPEDISSEIANMAKEPLYLQAMPDITKDFNKIPTLINRALVPAPILKSNKQLQQPLLSRKQENHSEPTFKSADMQPVEIDITPNTNKSSTLFKPIKLIPVANKMQTVLPTPKAFNNCSNDDQESDVSESQNKSLMETENRNTSTMRCNVTIPQYKRKKRTKKNTKWKNGNALATISKNNQMSSRKSNAAEIKANSCTSNVQKLSQSVVSNALNNIVNSNKHGLPQNKEQDISSDKKEQGDDGMTEQNGLNRIGSNRENEKSNSRVLATEDSKGAALEADQIGETGKRRHSVDEDEEALRAILLASLAKRSKPSDIVVNSITPVTTKPTISEASTIAQPKVLTEMVETRHDTALKSVGELIQTETLIANTAGKEKTISPSTAFTSNLPAPFQSRKRHLPIVKGSPRKIMRKVSIPASTKVVNNAKKYQNTIIQRKLIQQKVASRYNIQKTENNRLSIVMNNEKKWTASSKNLIIPEAQRIVINLESDTESDSESEKRKHQTPSSSNSRNATSRPPLMIPTTEFEKSVDQFLREARKKQESIASKPLPTSNVGSASQTLTKKSNSLIMSLENKNSSLRTPMAVRHLPASQQEEYRRLKQQILEHEKLKLRRTAENTLAKQKTLTTGAMLPNTSATETQTHVQQKTSLTNSNINLNKVPNDINTTSLKLMNASTPKSVSADKQTDKLNEIRNFNNKQINPVCTEADEAKKVMINHKVRIPEETAHSSNTSHARSSGASTNNGSPLQTTNTENPLLIDNINKLNSGLKILTKEELNRKFVRVHVDKESNSRIVTINEKSVSSIDNQATKISKGDAVTGTHTNVGEVRNVAQAQSNDIVSDNETRCDDDVTINSDTSTQIFSPVSRSTQTFDTTESTLSLSQYQTAKDEGLNEALSDMMLSVKNSIEDRWETIRQDTKTELNTLMNLSEEDKKQYLADTERKLINKRYTILKDLAQMVGTLRQWDIERDFQTSLVAEVKKLVEQLKVAITKLQEQRNLVKEMGPKVMIAHRKIDDERRDCWKLSKICSVLGTKVKGEGYSVPDAGVQPLIDGLKDVANHTRQLSKKKVPSLDIPDLYIQPTSAECLPSQTVRTESIQTDESSIDIADNDANSTMLQENEHQDSSDLTVDMNSSLQLSTTIINSTPVVPQEEQTHKLDSSDNISTSPNIENTTEVTPKTGDMNVQKCKERNNDVLRRQTQESFKTNVLETESSIVERAKKDVEHQPKKIIEPYVSILKHLQVPRNTNPNGVLCPYELMGTCNDADCQFIHQSKHVQ